ncbi:putative transcription factor C2H2 family [Helianthus annuus]|nr:putative transcription factor C2H2 family [Helianthus annuus]
MESKNSKMSQLVLPCTDDYGNFQCYLCRKYLTSDHKLYDHMRRHTHSAWRKVLPKKLKTCSAVVVRHTLPNPLLFDSDEDSLEDEECFSRDGEAVDLTKVLPEWNVVKKKRGWSGFKNGEGLSAKKVKEDEVVEEKKAGGGKVVFEFDLNEDPVEDEGCSYIHTLK